MVAVFQIGEMTILGDPGPLGRPLQIIARHLHDAFDAAGRSKTHCILCALTVRDFLIRLGFEASVASVAAIATNGQQTFVRGYPHNQPTNDKWAGHLVTICRGYLIDPTLYFPTEWPGRSGMFALPMTPGTRRATINGFRVLAEFEEHAGVERRRIAWVDRRENDSWILTQDGSNKNGVRELALRKLLGSTLASPDSARVRSDDNLRT